MVDSEESCTVWFNPGCSKCRGTRELLDERGVDATYFRYLEEAPSRADIERVMGLLGIDDPRAMMRTTDAVYAELRLDDADRDRLIDSMVEHPILVERPIVVMGSRAVIARPPERVLELLGSQQTQA